MNSFNNKVAIDREFYVTCPRIFLPKQIEVFNYTKSHDAILYSGAFRAGKTLLLDNVAITTCLENPGTIGMLVSQTDTQLYSVVFSLFENELQLYQNEVDKLGFDLQLAKLMRTSGKREARFYNGSKVLFRSCDDERKLAGYTLDFWGLDEPVDMKEGVFTQLIGRISGTGNLKNRFGLLTTNPGNEFHWIYEYFYLKKDEKFVHVDTTTYDNILLPDYTNYINRLEKSWDADWIRRYLNGVWGMFEGQIYKDFNPKKHVGDFKDLPVAYNIAGLDWGLENPHCLLTIGITGDERIIIRNEDYGRKKTTHELSEMITKRHKNFKYKKIFCDPSAADLIQQTYNLGVPIAYRKSDKLHSYANNDVPNGIAKVKSLFKNNKILVDENCINTIKELSAYRYKQGTDTPAKENDHACDALRYAVTDIRFGKTKPVMGWFKRW